MSRYDVELRVNIVAGPWRRNTGVTITHYDPSDPESRVEVVVRLDTSEREVTVLARELRPVVFEGAT